MSHCEPVVERFCIKEVQNAFGDGTRWISAAVRTSWMTPETGRRIEIRPDGSWMLYGS